MKAETAEVAESRRTEASLKYPLWTKALLFNGLLLMFTAAFTIHFLTGTVYRSPWPLDIGDLFYDRWPLFVDARFQLELSTDLNPYLSGRTEGYLPFAYVVFFGVSRLYETLFAPHIDLQSFIRIFSIGMILVFIVYLYRFITRAMPAKPLWMILLVFAPAVLSYPVVFMAHRGSFDLLLVPLLIAFFHFYRSRAIFAAICLGIATAFKPQVGIFSLVAFIDKNAISAALTLAVAGTLSACSLFVLEGSVLDNIYGFFHNQSEVGRIFGVEHLGMRYGHSFYNAIKILFDQQGTGAEAARSLKTYGIFSSIGIASVVLLLYVYREFYDGRKKLLIAALAICGFPYWSYDYKLAMLIPLIIINLRNSSNLSICLFALLLAPKHIVFLGGFSHPLLSISALINPIIIFLLLITELGSPWWLSQHWAGSRRVQPPLQP